MKYLLDTNIIIFFFKGKYEIHDKIDDTGVENCLVSEISVAELKYGAHYSKYPNKNLAAIDSLLEVVKIVPITPVIDLFAEEKARLCKAGNLIDDFDLLIGATAILNSLTLVTNNTRHFNRLQNIHLIDWTK